MWAWGAGDSRGEGKRGQQSGAREGRTEETVGTPGVEEGRSRDGKINPTPGRGTMRLEFRKRLNDLRMCLANMKKGEGGTTR